MQAAKLHLPHPHIPASMKTGTFPFSSLAFEDRGRPTPVDPAFAKLPSTDALFLHQMSYNKSLSPALPAQALTPASFIAGHITSDTQKADKIFEALLANGTLDKDTWTPVTSNITRNFTNEIDVLSVPQVKELVKLLFFWEAEVTRLTKLNQEEAQLKTELERTKSKDTQISLEQVDIQKTLRPTDRAANLPADDKLPTFSS